MLNKTIFLTGATGHYGATIAVALTQRHPRNRFVALVRADSAWTARERLIAKWRRLVGLDEARRLVRRWHVLAGDLHGLPGLKEPLIDEATHVVHLAANTSFVEKNAVWHANLGGTIALAERLRGSRHLERFIYTGTAMICGRREPGVVREDESPDASASHVAQYTASKTAAELALASRFADLPVVCVRPSVLAGHTGIGCRLTSSIFWAIRASHEIGLVPRSLDCAIDIVPFDWAADAMLHLLALPRLRHSRYHIAAGPAHRSRFVDIGRAFERHDGKPVHGRYAALPAAGLPLLKQRFFATYPRDALSIAMYRGLKRYFEFSVLDLAFDNTRLVAEGFSRPAPRVAEYLDACLRHPGRLGTLQMFEDDIDQFDRNGTASGLLAGLRAPAEAAQAVVA